MMSLRQRAQSVTEYGLVVALIAVGAIAGFEALRKAEIGYFNGMQPVLAPQAPAFGALLPTTTLTITGPISGTYGGTTTLTATLTSGGNPVANKSISFTINGVTECGVGAMPACPTTDGTGKASLTNVSLSGLAPGTYNVTATFTTDSSYLGSTASTTLTITANTSTSVGAVSATYGTTGVTVSATVTSAAGTVNSGNVVFTISVGSATCPTTGTGVVSGSASATCSLGALNVGTYNNAVTANYSGSTSFNNSSGQGTLTITPAVPTLVVDGGTTLTGTYGGTVTLTATLTGTGGAPLAGRAITFTLNGATQCGISGFPACPTTNASGVATLAGVSLAGLNAGSYATGIGASFAGDTNYSAINNTGALTINKATLTVTSQDASRVYGAPDPTFTVTYSGFVSGDSPSSLSGTLSCSSSATSTSTVSGSPYTISCSGQSSTNYTITYANTGKLTINTADTTFFSVTGSVTHGSNKTASLTVQLNAVNPSTATVNQGKVDFTVVDKNNNTICTSNNNNVDATGKATSPASGGGACTGTFSTASPPGPYTIKVTYNPPNGASANFNGSTGSGSLTVN